MNHYMGVAYRVTVLPSDILIVLMCMSKCKRLVGGTARIDFIEWGVITPMELTLS